MSNFALTVPISKVDVERREITGWASVSTDAAGKVVVDSQGDTIDIADLEAAAHDAFSSDSRAVAGDMHKRVGVGSIVESMVLTTEKRHALGLGDGPQGWVVTMKIHDDQTWADIRAGKKLELSIAGEAERVTV